MRIKLLKMLGCVAALALSYCHSSAQITLLKDYKNYTSAPIGTYQGINFREGGFSSMYPIAGTDGKEFWVCSDRGVNIDCATANTAAGCIPTYDKMFPFPNYAPKIHRVRLQGDSIQILQTITVKRPNGTTATGKMNPDNLGSTPTEMVSTDTVLDCGIANARFLAKTSPKDTFGIDAEGIIVDKAGNFWLCEEGGPTIWKLNRNGVAIKRYTPYANMGGVQSIDVQIDTVFKYRKNNRGFENMTMTPNGKIYAIIQSPILYPTKAVGEASRVHRILEIDPVTNNTRMLVYLNEGVIGASGSNQIRMQDWKLGDMAAINDSTFLVIEAALRGTSDFKRIYMININGATAITSGKYGTSNLTAEALVDSATLVANSIIPVKKKLFMDLTANGWPSALDKSEGLAIINDSTIAVCNDNDYGQVSTAQNGIPTATGNLSHILVYGLKGANKVPGYVPAEQTQILGTTGPNSSVAPYLLPIKAGVKFTSILTVGDGAGGYKMAGVPDGLGAFDNGNGTFTVVMNHEIGTGGSPVGPLGVTRAHGSAGAFVSKWIINKSDLSVVSGSDLIQTIKLWNPVTNSYITYSGAYPTPLAALNRFCSADLPAITAFYNPITGKGTQERIFMNGEESGNEGRAFAHIITGTEGGTSYEVPSLGKFSWENAVASPRISDTTVVGGTDDTSPLGQVYFYVGTKKATGNDIEKAGLTGGKLYGISVTGMTSEVSAPTPGNNLPFTMVDLGDVKNMTGATIDANSTNAGVTKFLRPEDAAWDPTTPGDFYFATTNSISAPSRLWRVRFTDPGDVTKGGTVTPVLDGTEGQKMLDNMAIDNSGHILLVEDVGGDVHLGRMSQYDIATDAFTQIAVHDSAYFLTNGSNYITTDEEASGQIDVQSILGPGMFLAADQIHKSIGGELVEMGQLVAFYNPDSYNSNPEVTLQSNAVTIQDGSTTTATTNNTDFGNVNTGATITKSFTIINSGAGKLNVNGIYFTGVNANEFKVVNAPAFPWSIAAVNGTQTFDVQFMPTATGTRNATLNVLNSDLDEQMYDVAIKGNGVSPDIRVLGNNVAITDGDATPGAANNTDFGTVNVGSDQSKTFTISNTGLGELKISSISISGAQASEFTMVNAPTFPLTIAGNATVDITVKFAPVAVGIRMAAVAVNSNDADAANYDFAVQGIAVEPTGVANTKVNDAFARLYPNPTGDAATVAITLKKEERIIVGVFSVEGKEVIHAVDKTFGAGEQQISLNTSSLASGTYYVQIATGSQVTKMKMVVVH